MSKATGQFLEHSPYCERDLRVPELPLTFDELGEFEVRIKARDCVHSYIYSYHPLDIVGWDGCYYPYCFNIDDFAPIVGKLHMPPPIHQTFEGHNFVICSFCPRVLDFHPNAIPIPYNHSNIDSDEILYYVEGNYKARRGIEVGSISLHPQGIPTGRTRAPSNSASGRLSPTSWPSCATPSARCSPPRPRSTSTTSPIQKVGEPTTTPRSSNATAATGTHPSPTPIALATSGRRDRNTTALK